MGEVLTRLFESLAWFCTGYVAATVVSGRSLNPIRSRKNSRRHG